MPTDTFHDVACTVCGCVCDDLTVRTNDGRITEVERACGLAQPWFDSLHDAQPPAAHIDGKPATWERALHQSAEILAGSRAPLVFGLSRSSTAGQRAAVFLADQLRGTIDTTASVCHGPSIMAIQQVGESTCTLGEVRNRADLVIFWGADPMESHPRHLERYSWEPQGLFVPGGRHDRKLIVIDNQPTATSELADLFIQMPRNADFEVIWALRQLLAGEPLPQSYHLGIEPAQLAQLTRMMVACRYGAVFFGLGLARQGIGHANVEALLRLVDDLNGHTRFIARRLRLPGDVTGADAVLCWCTGYPFAVNLARGYPRYNPGEYSASELLERHEVDACVLVGSESVLGLAPAAQQAIENIPTVALDYPNYQPTFRPSVQFTTAIYGIHAAGTAYRMDEVPIPLHRLIAADYPTDDQVLNALATQLTTAPTLIR